MNGGHELSVYEVIWTYETVQGEHTKSGKLFTSYTEVSNFPDLVCSPCTYQKTGTDLVNLSEKTGKCQNWPVTAKRCVLQGSY